ncbi:S24 family peptidase [Lactococcus lactis]|uniref:S24 family peptidase n=2 Tax=Lactococcus lactis TaxID=1358 RepID=UPI00288D0B07|nr:S24 family peptidase [Lactococcus lactis]MDT2889379.1 S24 family peptidase [Lactococcus lactis]
MKTDTSNRLKQIMAERNLKQVDILNLSIPFQKKFGIKLSKSTLSQYVNSVQSPDQNRIYLLAKTLGVSEAWLMGFDVPMVESSKIENDSETIEETITVMKKLEEPRQKIVLETANNQLDEQNQEKEKESKVIPINKIPDDLPPYISRKILENFVMPANTMEYEPDEDMVDVPILGRIAAGLPLDAVENFDGTRPVPAHFLSSARDYYWLMVDGHSMEPKIPFGSYVLIEAVPDVTDGTIGAVLFQDDCQATLKKIYHEIDCLRLVSINKEFKDQFATQDNPAAVIGQAVKVEIDL